MPIARTLVVRLAVLLERGHPGSEHPLVRESVRSRSNRSARCKEGEAATGTISSVAEAEVAAAQRAIKYEPERLEPVDAHEWGGLEAPPSCLGSLE